MSYGLPAGAAAPETPAEEWREKALQAIDSAVSDTGATTSTGGFVEAAPRTGSTPQGFVTGGGLGTSPNVQALSSTGPKHSEGLTREELLQGLSGREQAAAQFGAVQGQLAAASVKKDTLPGTAGAVSGGVAGSSPLAVNVPAQVIPSRTEAPSTHTPLVGGHLEHSLIRDDKPTPSPLSSVPVAPYQPATSSSLANPPITPHQPAYTPLKATPVAPTPASTVSPSVQVEKAISDALKAVRAPATGQAPVDTPAIEGMPGGWFGAKVGPGDRTTLTEDIVTGLDKVGQTAYNAVPVSLKETLNPNRHSTEPGLLDKARGVFNQLPSLADLTSPTSPDRKRTFVDNSATPVSPAKTRGSVSGGSGLSPEELISQAKHMASDLLQGSRSRAEQALAKAQEYVDHAVGANDATKTPFNSTTAAKTTTEHHSTAVAPASLPSQEVRGAKPGDYSSGVGALPGSVNETGVAILPEEKVLGADPFAAGTATAPTVTNTSTSSSSPATTDKSTSNSLTPAPLGASSSPSPAAPSAEPSSKAVVPVSSGALAATPDVSSLREPSTSAVPAAVSTSTSGYAPTGPSAGFSEGRPYDDRDLKTSSTSQAHEPYTPKGPSASFGTAETAQPSSYGLAGSEAVRAEQPEKFSSSTGPNSGHAESTGNQGSGYEQSHNNERDIPATHSTILRSSPNAISRDEPQSAGHGVPVTTSHTPHLLSRDLISGSQSKSVDLGLAAPLGAIVESTPIVGEKTDRHHNILPGGIKPALTSEPVKTIPVTELPKETPSLVQEAALSTKDTPVSTNNAPVSKQEVPVSGSSASRSVHVIDSSRSHGTDVKPSTTPSVLSERTTASSEGARLDQPSAGRLDSSASVTAIKHGHLGNPRVEKEGSAHSTLESVSEKPLPVAPASTKADDVVKRSVGEQGVTGSTGASPTDRHASPASVKYDTSAVSDVPASPISSRTAVGHNRKSSIDAETSHHRTSSTSSDKKKGFLSKIKDKLHHEKH